MYYNTTYATMDNQSNALVSIKVDGINTIYQCNVTSDKYGSILENLTFMSKGYAIRVFDIDANDFPLLTPENIPETQHKYFIF